MLTIFVRLWYYSDNPVNGNNATSWDALGYYQYLPGTFIYGDVDKLAWMSEVDEKYHVTGGYFYQATELENGNRVGKYLGGVAILELPFFALGHLVAKFTGQPQDGFSAPYQYAILWGAICWFLLGLAVLRKVLLRYYSEVVVSLTLILVVGATNVLQYVSFSGAMSHAYIFPLYALILYYSIQWTDNPKPRYALRIGLILGIAAISRPTELIMLFIPLLWFTSGEVTWRKKWDLIVRYKWHLGYTALALLVAVSPQLIYWKHVTGSWVYDVGSKWNFHNPWWRVLIGFEKGWLIYTPVTLFFLIGLFFLKSKPFRLATIVFCVLNLWIIMSWHEWRYGASYSTRALVQSYPVFALAFAAFLERIYQGRRRFLVLLIGGYLVFVNLFQIWQYNHTILHYDHMNARYYQAIYLDADPTPLDYSLLDTDELLSEQDRSQLAPKLMNHYAQVMELGPGEQFVLGTIYKQENSSQFEADIFIRPTSGILGGSIKVRAYKNAQIIKEKNFRTGLPFRADGLDNYYAHDFIAPADYDSIVWSLESFTGIRITDLNFSLKVLDQK